MCREVDSRQIVRGSLACRGCAARCCCLRVRGLVQWGMLEALKVCTICNLELPADRAHFSPQTRGKYGLHSQCHSCRALRAAARYAADPDRGRQAAANWRKANAAKVALSDFERYRRNADRNSATVNASAASIRTCPGCGDEKPLSVEFFHRAVHRRSGYSSQCKSCRASVVRRWRAANSDRFREIETAYRPKRYANLRNRLSRIIGNRIRDNLRGRKARKPWSHMVGYTVDDLRRHIERQFAPGMSWENYGEWHIDHIVPVAAFDFSSPDDPDFVACWALSNLRPLWAGDNMTKHARREFLV